MKIEFTIDEDDPAFAHLEQDERVERIEDEFCRLLHDSHLNLLMKQIKVMCKKEDVIEEGGEEMQAALESFAAWDAVQMGVFNRSLSRSLNDRRDAERKAKQKDRDDRGESYKQQQERTKGLVAVDYHDIIAIIEKKHDIDTRDYLKRHLWEAEEEKKLQIENPHIDYKLFMNTVPADYTDEQREFNTKWREIIDVNMPRYLDFWHWVIDNVGVHIRNKIRVFPIQELIDSENTPKWVKEILNMILEEVKDRDAYENGIVNFYFDW